MELGEVDFCESSRTWILMPLTIVSEYLQDAPLRLYNKYQLYIYIYVTNPRTPFQCLRRIGKDLFYNVSVTEPNGKHRYKRFRSEPCGHNMVDVSSKFPDILFSPSALKRQSVRSITAACFLWAKYSPVAL